MEIQWPRKTGKRRRALAPVSPDAMIEETVNAIPARYNRHSSLTAVIKPGDNDLDFALTTKP